MANIQPTGFGIVGVRTKSVYHLLTRTLTQDKHDLIGFYYMAASTPKVLSSSRVEPKYSVLLYDVNSGCITSLEPLHWNTLLEDSKIESITYSQLICPDIRVKKEFEIQFQTFVTTLITERANTNQIKHKELIERGIHQRLLSILQEDINLKTGYVIVNSILSVLATVCLGSHVRHTTVPDDMLLDTSILQSPITFTVDSISKSHCDFNIHLVLFCNSVRHLLTTRDDILHYVVSGINEFSVNRKYQDVLMDATSVTPAKQPVIEKSEVKSNVNPNIERLLDIETMLFQAMQSHEYNQAVILIEELNSLRQEANSKSLPLTVPSILHESNAVVTEISKLRDYVDEMLNQISSGTIPIIRMNDVVQKVNSLCKVAHIDTIDLNVEEFSASYSCILTMEDDLHVDPDIRVELKSGENIILPVANANVSGISTPVLIEILHYLNGLPYREKRFTPLRICITAEISRRQN